MPSTFGILNSALSGLNSAQIGLNLTSQNISNSNTTGYTRQMLDTSATPADSAGNRYQLANVSVGNGVTINGVYQVRNNFLDAGYRNQNSEYNMWNGMNEQLTPIEDDFNEITSSTTTDNTLTGLSGQLSDIVTSLNNYETSPNDTNLAADVQSKVDMLTQSINQDASQLSTTMSDEQNELGIVVNGGAGDTASGPDLGGINGMITSIQGLNVQIANSQASGQQANDLNDQRNELLDQLSSDIDISTTEQKNGMVTVKLSGDNSNYLIDSQNNTNQLTIGTDATSNATVLKWNDGTTAQVQSGLVKAYLNVINGDGSGTDDITTGKCGNLGIPALETQLNNFAIGLYNVFNNVNNVAEPSANMTQSPNVPQFLTYTGDTFSSTAGVADPTADPTNNTAAQASGGLMYVASSIQLSSQWSQDSSYFSSSYIQSDNGSYYTSYANALQNTVNTVPTSANGSTTYSGSLSNYADSFTQKLSSSISEINEQANWSQTNVTNIDQQRQSVSSVSTDDEGVNIIKYQQAYDASARVITTIDNMLGTLIDSTGVSST